MKKTLNFSQTLQRVNEVKAMIYSFFLYFASYPRLLLEVFIRKGFGERYFKLSSALTVALLLAVWPFVPSYKGYSFKQTEIMPDYLLWYVFIAGFVAVSILHHRAQKRSAGVYDFKRYSLYSGKINPFFRTITFPRIKNDVRLIECWLEPAGFFFLGLFLALIGQKLGGLLVGCSIFYAIGYRASYFIGDNHVMDMIDKMIVNEEMEKAFMDDADEEETRGFRYVGRKPEDQNLRRRVFDSMTGKEEVFEAR